MKDEGALDLHQKHQNSNLSDGQRKISTCDMSRAKCSFPESIADREEPSPSERKRLEDTNIKVEAAKFGMGLSDAGSAEAICRQESRRSSSRGPKGSQKHFEPERPVSNAFFQRELEQPVFSARAIETSAAKRDGGPASILSLQVLTCRRRRSELEEF